MELQRITHDALREDMLPERSQEYRRIIGGEGRDYAITCLLDTATFDALLSACENLVVWCEDENEGNFHAIIQIERSLEAYDPREPRLVRISLLARENIFYPVVFNPLVFG